MSVLHCWLTNSIQKLELSAQIVLSAQNLQPSSLSSGGLCSPSGLAVKKCLLFDVCLTIASANENACFQTAD